MFRSTDATEQRHGGEGWCGRTGTTHRNVRNLSDTGFSSRVPCARVAHMFRVVQVPTINIKCCRLCQRRGRGAGAAKQRACDGGRGAAPSVLPGVGNPGWGEVVGSLVRLNRAQAIVGGGGCAGEPVLHVLPAVRIQAWRTSSSALQVAERSRHHTHTGDCRQSSVKDVEGRAHTWSSSNSATTSCADSASWADVSGGCGVCLVSDLDHGCVDSSCVEKA